MVTHTPARPLIGGCEARRLVRVRGMMMADYEYSGSITNGGKKPAESLAQIQTQPSHN